MIYEDKASIILSRDIERKNYMCEHDSYILVTRNSTIIELVWYKLNN